MESLANLENARVTDFMNDLFGSVQPNTSRSLSALIVSLRHHGHVRIFQSDALVEGSFVFLLWLRYLESTQSSWQVQKYTVSYISSKPAWNHGILGGWGFLICYQL